MASFLDFAIVCQELGQTQSRKQMADCVGAFLAALDIGEAAIAARFMVGRALEQGEDKRLQISGRAVWKIANAIALGEAEAEDSSDDGEDIFSAAEDFGEAIEILLRRRRTEPEPSLTIAELARVFAEIANIEGRRARARKLELLRSLLERATALEAKFIAKILIREMRHGVSEGMMIEALAQMSARPVAEVRRLHMLEGDLGRVVMILRGALPTSGLDSGAPSRAKPMKPMLAQPAGDVAEAFAMLGPELALEHKLDGMRVQVHHTGKETHIFSRRMNEITATMPEVGEIAARLGERATILDGEVIAIGAGGRPVAFGELARRFGRLREIEKLREELPIRLYAFDLLSLDGALLIDRPYVERIAMLGEVAAEAGIDTVTRIERPSLEDGEKFFRDAIAAGFEGVVAKSLKSTYTPGARGRGWVKVKHARTLDLVIIAAEWGYGRRHGWLSNYHLAARDESSGELKMVGKTFKGLTDSEFASLTERLLALKTEQAGNVVSVHPRIVVEVAYNEVLPSRSYEAGVGLRFARITRIREDKSPDEADTIQTMEHEYERQVALPSGAKA